MTPEPDGDTDNDVDIMLASTLTLAVISPASPIVIAEPGDFIRDGNTIPLAADLTVKENVVAGPSVWSDGYRSGRMEAGNSPRQTLEKHLDGVLTDSNRFIARTTAREVSATPQEWPLLRLITPTTLNVEYTGGAPIEAGEEYIITLSVNGDTGFVNRTGTSKIRMYR